MYEGPAERWPELEPPEPIRPGLAMSVCLRPPSPAQFLEWDTVDDALQAAQLLFDGPCDRWCLRAHSVLWSDLSGRLHVRAVVGDEPPRRRLADQFDELYPRHQNGSTIANEPRLWPMPSAWNPPLMKGPQHGRPAGPAGHR